MNRDVYKYVREITAIQTHRIESELIEAERKKNRFDKNMMAEGLQYAKSGLSLEDAPEDKRNDYSFISGYEKGMRLLNVNDEMFLKGAKAYFDGINLADIPDSDRENELFVQGYEDAITMSSSKKR